MISEIKIITKESNNHAKGHCFERLVRKLVEIHRYEVSSNVNYTGMEIDLIAKHLDRANETLYVECKAKAKVSSDEITKFAFNVSHKKANFGYFIRTQELEHQAAGLVQEMKDDTDSRYDNLTFFEPKKVIEMLVDSGVFHNIQLPKLEITKRILIISHIGDYFLFLISESTSSLTTSYILVDAKTGEDVSTHKTIEAIESETPEISGVSRQQLKSNVHKVNDTVSINGVEHVGYESISEVQSSDYWYDYLPTSVEHLVGRVDVTKSLVKFLKDVASNSTNRRAFCLTGKSGWGKSSLISGIRGKTRNKHYRNRFFTTAIDTRSATSPNFPALAFEKMIRNAIASKFIVGIPDNFQLQFASNFDLLGSESVQQILTNLKNKNRFLILIFDQFEDVFRKQGYFKPFYKLLSDITDQKPNIIIGFSWKSEILIPIENDAYHHWQQAKDQANMFEIPAFGSREISGVIRQLELEVKPNVLPKGLKQRITENSQSLPWLTKKLCIHIFKQVKSGVSIEQISEENLNIKTLFEGDLENLNPEEIRTLKYIANKGRSGTFLDISQLGKDVEAVTVESLREKRLIIRSGLTYTIYWDIFRDYLATNEIPVIGEGYLFRQSAKVCSEVFTNFKTITTRLTLSEIKDLYKRKISDTSISNIVLELRNIGIINKDRLEDVYYVTPDINKCDKETFVRYVTEKLKIHTICSKLEEMPDEVITTDQVSKLLRSSFQGYDFKERTWNSYAQYIVGWILYSEHPLKLRVLRPQKGRKKGQLFGKDKDSEPIRRHRTPSLHLRHSLQLVEKAIVKLHNGETLNGRVSDDLYRLNLIDNDGRLNSNGTNIFLSNERKLRLSQTALALPKVNEALNIISNKNICNGKELLNALPHDFYTATKQSSLNNYASVLMSWLKPLINSKNKDLLPLY